MSDRKKPYVVDEKKGNKAICNCAQSGDRPYCDGSHSGSGKTPIIVTLEDDKKVAWCGCRESKNFPYCDGTHASL